MPLEIRELYIKVSVSDEDREQDTEQSYNNGSNTESDNQEEIVQLCVEKVIQILKDQQER